MLDFVIHYLDIFSTDIIALVPTCSGREKAELVENDIDVSELGLQALLLGFIKLSVPWPELE